MARIAPGPLSACAVFSLSILFMGCADQPKTQGTIIDRSLYSPPVGDVVCNLTFGTKRTKFDELFSDTQGAVVFSYAGIWTRLDIVGLPPSLESTTLENSFLLEAYFLESFLPYLSQDEIPGGKLTRHYSLERDGKSLHYGQLHYPDGFRRPGVLGTRTEPKYIGTIVYYLDGFVYSISTSMPETYWGKSGLQDRGNMVDDVLSEFRKCKFGAGVVESAEHP